jgi:branched-chain amino acid transport system substrate-binding protein
MSLGKMDRRRFLKLAGGGAGVAALVPLTSGGSVLAGSRGASLRVGVLVPSGGEYAAMGPSFLQGLRLGFSGKGAGATSSITTAEAAGGFAGAGSGAQALVRDGVDVVVAGVTLPVAGQIGPILADAGIPLVVANMGAHVVRPSDRDPNALHVTLGAGQSSFALGRWAARAIGTKALLTTALADGGYDLVYAFRRGFESGGGGVVDTVVTHVDREDIDGLARAISGTGPDLVFATHTGSRAVGFVRAYAKNGRTRGTPLLMDGFGVDESLLGRQGTSALGIRSGAAWSPRLRLPATREFQRLFRAATGRRADAFALLGYDAARLVRLGVERSRTAGSRLRNLPTALAGATMESPRGATTVEPTTNALLGPTYLRRVSAGADGFGNTVLHPLDPVAAFPGELGGLEGGMRSGYVNEYLST